MPVGARGLVVSAFLQGCQQVSNMLQFVTARVRNGSLAGPSSRQDQYVVRVHGFVQGRDYEESLADFQRMQELPTGSCSERALLVVDGLGEIPPDRRAGRTRGLLNCHGVQGQPGELEAKSSCVPGNTGDWLGVPRLLRTRLRVRALLGPPQKTAEKPHFGRLSCCQDVIMCQTVIQ
jgi:hypothetical protein